MRRLPASRRLTAAAAATAALVVALARGSRRLRVAPALGRRRAGRRRPARRSRRGRLPPTPCRHHGGGQRPRPPHQGDHRFERAVRTTRRALGSRAGGAGRGWLGHGHGGRLRPRRREPLPWTRSPGSPTGGNRSPPTINRRSTRPLGHQSRRPSRRRQSALRVAVDRGRAGSDHGAPRGPHPLPRLDLRLQLQGGLRHPASPAPGRHVRRTTKTWCSFWSWWRGRVLPRPCWRGAGAETGRSIAAPPAATARTWRWGSPPPWVMCGYSTMGPSPRCSNGSESWGAPRGRSSSGSAPSCSRPTARSQRSAVWDIPSRRTRRDHSPMATSYPW
jgi:hypothetical protein